MEHLRCVIDRITYQNAESGWLRIPQGRELTEAEQNYVVKVIMRWIEMQMRQ